MVSLTWIRHEVAPWERTKGYTAEYAVHLGKESWIIVGKRRVFDSGKPRWTALWAPAGFRGVGPHIVVILFATRTLAAAKALVELWTSSRSAP